MANTGLLELNGKDIVTVIQEETTDKVNQSQIADMLTKTEANTTYLGISAKAASATVADTANSVNGENVVGAVATATSATSATNAENATKATQDASGNVITSTYATKTELSSGLSGKQNAGDYATTSQVNAKINLSGSRGQLAGYETSATLTSLSVTQATQDSILYNSTAAITCNNGSAGTAWIKVVMLAQVPSSVNLGSSWAWVGGSAPTLAANGILVLSWQNTRGLANFLSPSA